ncbi:restriction endonuclease subunit S [Paracoccus actinidiae]|uniref:restriction endonuclease subunit S n=1 Tax=Paracoccus actinidiae TaxID=3064531 RepID=UPI0027D2F1B9|nr:restriction endonuclease subunit S [Paracoccus sp. M09]
MNIAAFPAYDSYKDSGVEWIGDVPSSWSVERGKWLFIKKDRPVRAEDDIVTCFRDGEVTLRSNRRTDGFTNALKEHGYQGIRKGDLVIHAMDAFAGAIGVSDSDGKATPVYSACVPRNADAADPHFYAYYIRNIALSGLLVSLAKGIRERSTDFRYNDFADLALAVPSLAEQLAITSFLDEKCAKIEEAVRIKEEQIALLRERRQILIQQAVTRGLNPDAPMKDSGIDWIGQIPAHWEIVPLKRLFRERNDRSTTGGETLLSLRMNEGLVPHDDVSDKPIGADALKDYKQVFPGQLVMNRMRASIGIFGIVTSTGIVSPDYAIFDIAARANGVFFLQLFKTGVMGQQFRNASRGLGTGSSGFMRLYTDDFGAISVALPPTTEQTEIVIHINNLSEEIRDAVRLKEDQIAALKEYKTSLINAAVTGKIKVV